MAKALNLTLKGITYALAPTNIFGYFVVTLYVPAKTGDAYRNYAFSKKLKEVVEIR